jgi:CRP-like cAMP-binding protein
MTIKSAHIVESFGYKSDALFNGLPDKVKSDFFKEFQFKNYKKGQNIFSESSYPAGIYFIKKGKVKTFRNLENGKEHVIYIYVEGELLGYAAFFSEESYHDSAATIEESEIGFMHKDKITSLLTEHSELSQMIMKNLSWVFGVMVNSVVTLAHKTVRERVALTLLILHEKFNRTNRIEEEVTIEMRREDFASLAGTAVETLVRLLKEFREDELIETRGKKIIIKNRVKLMEIAEMG